MRRIRKFALLVGAPAAMLAASVGSSWAAPLNNTAFVDPKSGVDSGTCGGVTQQCATLNQALNNITAGGVIYVQSGGTFGPIYLTAPVSIVGPDDGSLNVVWSASPPGCIGSAPGTCGLPTANSAVEIAAGPNDTIKFKNILFNNAGSTNGAMKIGNAFNVSMTATVLRGGGGTIAQMMTVTPNTGAQFQLFMSRCDVAFSSSGGGILIQPQGTTTAKVHLLNTEIHNAKFGIKLDGSVVSSPSAGVQAAIEGGGFFSFNGSAIAAIGTSSGFSHVSLTRNNVLNAGGQAVQINGANASISMFESTITGNAVGVNIQASGKAFSLSNNDIYDNGTDCSNGGVPDGSCSFFIPRPQR